MYLKRLEICQKDGLGTDLARIIVKALCKLSLILYLHQYWISPFYLTLINKKLFKIRIFESFLQRNNFFVTFIKFSVFFMFQILFINVNFF